MRGPSASSIFLTLLILLLPSPASATPYQAPLGPVPAAIPFTFRNGTVEDVDDITTVYIDAFRRAPLWKYIRQFEDEVDPLYGWSCQRDAYLAVIQQPNIVTKVITVPDPDPGSLQQGQGAAAAAARERVVSVAIWDFNRTSNRHEDGDEGSSSSHLLSPMFPLPLPSVQQDGSTPVSSSSSSSSSSPFNCSAHLDMNLTRAIPYSDKLVDAEHRYLYEPIPRQLYLGLLATHPDWDGNGFAAHHLHWGKAQLAKLRGGIGDGDGGGGALPITLIGTPAGYPVYVSEGFEGLKNITVERLDGGGIFWHEVMKYEDVSAGMDEL